MPYHLTVTPSSDIIEGIQLRTLYYAAVDANDNLFT